MKAQKITLGIAALAVGGLQTAHAGNAGLISQGALSAAAKKQLQLKQQKLKRPQAPGTAQVFVELGDPWIEWQQESARQFQNRTINPADITARFNQFRR